MMTADLQSFLFPLLGTLAGGVGVYAAIRADLADLRARVTIAERMLDRLDNRVDQLHNCRAGDDHQG